MCNIGDLAYFVDYCLSLYGVPNEDTDPNLTLREITIKNLQINSSDIIAENWTSKH